MNLLECSHEQLVNEVLRLQAALRTLTHAAQEDSRLLELLRFAYSKLEYLEDEGPTGYGWTSQEVGDWLEEVKPLIK